MDAIWSLVRVARSRGRLGGVLLLAALIGWASSFQIAVSTPNGVQCPTAPVQAVAQVVTCCAKAGGKTIQSVQRPIRPGDKGFVQCRCAEKRAAEHQPSVAQGGTHFEMLCPQPLTVVVPTLDAYSAPTPFAVAPISAVLRSPSVPPPSLL